MRADHLRRLRRGCRAAETVHMPAPTHLPNAPSRGARAVARVSLHLSLERLCSAVPPLDDCMAAPFGSREWCDEMRSHVLSLERQTQSLARQLQVERRKAQAAKRDVYDRRPVPIGP